MGNLDKHLAYMVLQYLQVNLASKNLKEIFLDHLKKIKADTGEI